MLRSLAHLALWEKLRFAGDLGQLQDAVKDFRERLEDLLPI